MRALVVLTLLAALATVALAAETPESIAKRIAELQKANLVLQEDLARAQLALDATQADLRSEIAARKDLKAVLDKETTARHALTTALAEETAAREALHARLAADIALMKEQVEAKDGELEAKVATLEGALEKANATIGTLTASLDEERSARLAAEAETARLHEKQRKNDNRDRMLTYFGILVGGIGLATQ